MYHPLLEAQILEWLEERSFRERRMERAPGANKDRKDSAASKTDTGSRRQ